MGACACSRGARRSLEAMRYELRFGTPLSSAGTTSTSRRGRTALDVMNRVERVEQKRIRSNPSRGCYCGHRPFGWNRTEAWLRQVDGLQ